MYQDKSSEYYEQYSDKAKYMEYFIENSYEYNENVYYETTYCYKAYSGEYDNEYYAEYNDYYNTYRDEYSKLKGDYYNYKDNKDYKGMYDTYNQIVALNYKYYQYTDKVYDAYYQYYADKPMDRTSRMYKYMAYYKMYKEYQKNYYTNYYARYNKTTKGYNYSVVMLKTDDILPYPHKDTQYNDNEYNKMKQMYDDKGFIIPLMVSSKMGEDGKPYYHLMDGYYMYKVLKDNGENFVPAIVYYDAPHDKEDSYLQAPYMEEFKNYN